MAVQALGALEDPRAVLVVVGGASGRDGRSEIERIDKLAASLGVADRIRFTDPQPHHLLSTYYRAADVVLVPSRSESFGLVALEAAACGTPVVAAAVGGLRTLVEHGRTGFLVEGRDAGCVRGLHRADPRQPGSGPSSWPPRPAVGPATSPGRPPPLACAASTPTSPPGRRSHAADPASAVTSWAQVSVGHE